MYGGARKEKRRCTRKRKQCVGSYMGHLKGGSLHVWRCTERRDARGKKRCTRKRKQCVGSYIGHLKGGSLHVWGCAEREEEMHEEKECVRITKLDPCQVRVIGLVASYPLSMREILGSTPTWSIPGL